MFFSGAAVPWAPGSKRSCDLVSRLESNAGRAAEKQKERVGCWLSLAINMAPLRGFKPFPVVAGMWNWRASALVSLKKLLPKLWVMTRICNLLYRRIGFGRPSDVLMIHVFREVRRLKICDTADYKSALRHASCSAGWFRLVFQLFILIPSCHFALQ